MKAIEKPAAVVEGLTRWANALEAILADRRGRGFGAEPKTFDIENQRKLLLDAALMLKQPSTDVAGGSELSIAELERRVLFYIEQEQVKPAPDTFLIGLLCEVVRMAREYVHWAAVQALPPG
jgi:hypothetical protein